jgi:hypothetical protein
MILLVIWSIYLWVVLHDVLCHHIVAEKILF